jgi:excisionase family DNA binding protein
MESTPEHDLDELLAPYGEFLGIDDVAQLMNVSRPTVSRALDDEEDPLPHYRFGRLTRIPKKDFRAWLLRHRRG